ncbi:Uncharacterised protein [Streptococcus pneumoniae]|nr:Uncharacterised protein [Streptococcus pneumoniae]
MKIKKLLKMVIPVLMISAVGTTFVEANQIGVLVILLLLPVIREQVI